MTRRSSTPVRVLIWRVCVVAVMVAALLVINFSFPLADWWGRHVKIAGRPTTGELDVHVAMWFLLGVISVVLVGRWFGIFRWGAVLPALWTVSVVIELLQPRITLRTFEWTDMIGNTIGVILAGFALTRIRGLRRLSNHQDQDVIESDRLRSHLD